MNNEPINWSPPQATDNVHEPKVASSHEPKSEFGIGTTEIIYTATDGAGNKAKCTFNVTLIYGECQTLHQGWAACGLAIKCCLMAEFEIPK